MNESINFFSKTDSIMYIYIYFFVFSDPTQSSPVIQNFRTFKVLRALYLNFI